MSAAAMQLPAEKSALTVVPDPEPEEKAWNFGEIPVQGELFPWDYVA